MSKLLLGLMLIMTATSITSALKWRSAYYEEKAFADAVSEEANEWAQQLSRE